MFFHDRYEVPIAVADAAAHPNQHPLVDYDPIGGNVAVLFLGWLFPLLPCLFTLLLIYLCRRLPYWQFKPGCQKSTRNGNRSGRHTIRKSLPS